MTYVPTAPPLDPFYAQFPVPPVSAGGGASTVAPLSGLLGKGASTLAPRGLIPTLAPALIGQQLSQAVDVPGHGNWEAAGRGALTGAGVGATVGLAGGPFAGISVPVGTAVGAAVGGVASTLANTFFGEESQPDYRKTLADSASSLGLDPNQYTVAFDLLKKSGADEKTLGTQLAQQLLQDAATKKQQAQMQQAAAQQHAGDQRYALAMQAQAQQFFTPYVNNIVPAGQSQSQLLQGLAANLPAPYRDVMMNQAQQAIGQSQRLAGAYAAQSAMLPSQYMMSQDLKRQQELATLQYQQAVVNAQQGGGGQDFSSYAAKLAGQPAGG